LALDPQPRDPSFFERRVSFHQLLGAGDLEVNVPPQQGGGTFAIRLRQEFTAQINRAKGIGFLADEASLRVIASVTIAKVNARMNASRPRVVLETAATGDSFSSFDWRWAMTPSR
jgi:hypothetical protein